MKKIFKIFINNSNALLIFLTIIALVFMINISLDSSRKAGENLYKSVLLYTDISTPNTDLKPEKILSIVESFSGEYFGWGANDVSMILAELSSSKYNPDKQIVLRLITSYQALMDKRLHSFDTLLYFLSVAVIIQFIFLIVTTNRARTAGNKLKDSEEVLKLLNLAREKEHLRISSVLHDSILQDIGRLLLSPGMKNSGPAADELRKISANLREMTYQIAPLQIKTTGLEDAVKDLILQFQTKTSCNVEYSINSYRENMLNNDEKLVFYRILQESLANIRKHANASNIVITLILSHPYLIMRIRDDGIGFVLEQKYPKKRSHRNIGMLLMNEQASSIGATLIGESTPGKGTSITLKYKFKGS